MIEEKSQALIENPQTPDTCEQEMAEILCVTDKTPDINQEIEPKSPEKTINQENQPFVPGGIKTRADLIIKIQESANVVGNHSEVKSLQLHRRRKNSLESILREQVARAVEAQSEKDLGIPEDTEGRLNYAIDMLYSFDLCLCKALEKACEFVQASPVEITGFAKTIDSDPRIKHEIKQSFKDWISESEGMRGWVESCASPSTRLLLCHLYPLMAVARKKGQKLQEDLPVNLKLAAARAKLRATLDPPRPRTVAEDMPAGVRLVYREVQRLFVYSVIAK